MHTVGRQCLWVSRLKPFTSRKRKLHFSHTLVNLVNTWTLTHGQHLYWDKKKALPSHESEALRS